MNGGGLKFYTRAFAAILEQLAAIRAEKLEACTTLQAEYNARAVEAWREAVAATPRRKVPLQDDGRLLVKGWQAIPEGVREALTAEYAGAKAPALVAGFDTRIARVERALRWLAPRAEIRETESALEVDCWTDSHFSTQTDAVGYARGAADNRALELGTHVKTQVWPSLGFWGHRRGADGKGPVEPLSGPYVTGSRYGVTEFRVVLFTDELGAEIAARRPKMPLREWVRACWKRGINPRVLSPWLPAGYEEREGLDYFGGETRAAGVRT